MVIASQSMFLYKFSYVQDTFKKLFAERFVPQGFLKEEVVFDGYRVPVNVTVQIFASLSDWHDPSASSL